jgi:hypothetical protein
MPRFHGANWGFEFPWGRQSYAGQFRSPVATKNCAIPHSGRRSHKQPSENSGRQLACLVAIIAEDRISKNARHPSLFLPRPKAWSTVLENFARVSTQSTNAGGLPSGSTSAFTHSRILIENVRRPDVISRVRVYNSSNSTGAKVFKIRPGTRIHYGIIISYGLDNFCINQSSGSYRETMPSTIVLARRHCNLPNSLRAMKFSSALLP